MRRALLVIAAGALLAAGASGCGSSGTSNASSATGSTPAPTSTITPPASTGQVESTSTAVPSRLPDPQFDHGQTIYIGAQSLRPNVLVSDLGKPVVWRNDTGHSVQLVFDHVEIAPVTIPAGSSFVYTPPTAVSMTYHVTAGSSTLHGAVQVTPVGT